MKAADLRKSILQAAVQGKLVPQNPHDEPATKLLERIRKGKAQLLKEGKIKKEKRLPPIHEEDSPFDLPEGWVWCRLGEIVIKNTGGGTPSKQRDDYWGGDIPWASVKDMNVECISRTKDYITIKGLENSSTNIIEENSIIVCTRMGLGKIAINTIPLAINQDLRALQLSEFVDKRYFILAYKTLSLVGSGMTVKGIKIDELHSLPFPLPSFAEQQRIVTKFNELMSFCDKLEAAEKKLNTLESNFARYLPKSILQAGVQGKLVPQNIHDEPADKLLERIKTEKSNLVKSGKLKKEKSLPPITEDEVPYDLPGGWAWCRLNDLCEYVQRGKSPKYSDEKRIPVLSQKCVQWSGVTLEKAKFIAPYSIENYGKERFIKHNDLLWNSTGHGTLGRIGIVDAFKEKFDIVVVDSHVTVVRCIQHFVSAKYLLIWLSSPHVQSEIVSKSSGSTNQIELATSTIKEYIIPLPPLAEQQRIVAKVNELMSLCNALKAAHDAPVCAPVPATVIPFSHQQEEPEMLMAARGAMPKTPSKALQDARNRLFEN